MYTKGQKLVAVRDGESIYGNRKFKAGEVFTYYEDHEDGDFDTTEEPHRLFNVRDFKPYEEAKVFKVGDKVRAIRDTKSLYKSFPKGTVMYVGIGSDTYNHKSFGGGETARNADKYTFKTEDFELVTDDTKTFKATWENGQLITPGGSLPICAQYARDHLGLPNGITAGEFEITVKYIGPKRPKFKDYTVVISEAGTIGFVKGDKVITESCSRFDLNAPYNWKEYKA